MHYIPWLTDSNRGFQCLVGDQKKIKIQVQIFLFIFTDRPTPEKCLIENPSCQESTDCCLIYVPKNKGHIL